MNRSKKYIRVQRDESKHTEGRVCRSDNERKKKIEKHHEGGEAGIMLFWP